MTDQEFCCSRTKTFWHYYVLKPTKEHFDKIVSYFSEELVLIGTGKHEFFTDLDQMMKNIEQIQSGTEPVCFNVIDEWYECLTISSNVYLVYGGLWARQHELSDSEIPIDMDVRFSVLYRKHNKKWEIIHIHHSIPFAEQQHGEYYPKSLSEKAKEAMSLAKQFEKKSELDLMTELYNNESFKLYAQQQMNVTEVGNMYVFDIDYFKQVNDNHGHMAGDELLKLFSQFLKQNFSDYAIIGRMGGDEFAIFEYIPLDKEDTIQKILSMQKNFEQSAKKMLEHGTASYSVGIASMIRNHHYTYDTLYANADRALYQAKQVGRQTYYWYDE
ncbi:MAG: diguanylate cyclase [Lachnospiraceae bacterium]